MWIICVPEIFSFMVLFEVINLETTDQCVGINEIMITSFELYLPSDTFSTLYQQDLDS